LFYKLINFHLISHHSQKGTKEAIDVLTGDLADLECRTVWTLWAELPPIGQVGAHQGQIHVKGGGRIGIHNTGKNGGIKV
jgi:hypothetical protein